MQLRRKRRQHALLNKFNNKNKYEKSTYLKKKHVGTVEWEICLVWCKNYGFQ